MFPVLPGRSQLVLPVAVQDCVEHWEEGLHMGKLLIAAVWLETHSMLSLMDPETAIGTQDNVPRSYECWDVACEEGLAGCYDRQDMA